MTATTLDRQFAEFTKRLAVSDATRAARTTALVSFETLGFPDRSIETWHYTDLGMLARKELCFVPPELDAGLLKRARAWLAEAGLVQQVPRMVFVNGRFAPSLSGVTVRQGLSMRLLAEDSGSLLNESAVAPGSALAAINTAFAADGVKIHVDSAIADPIHLVFIGGKADLASQLRVTIEIAAAARAIVIQHFADLPDTGESWLNLVTDVSLGEGSTLELHRLQTHGPDQLHTSLTRATLDGHSKLVAGNLEIGGKLVRNELELALSGESAEAELFGLAVGRNRQHIDNRWAVDHRMPSTNSRQDYRAIVDDSSRSVFNGKVTVRQDAQQVDARQRNDNLLLSPRAEADTKPELEIYADQVACSHGATVGELSEDHVFYLRSRGIEESTARAMLTAAFAERITRRFAAGWAQERVSRLVSRRFPSLEVDREAAA